MASLSSPLSSPLGNWSIPKGLAHKNAEGLGVEGFLPFEDGATKGSRDTCLVNGLESPLPYISNRVHRSENSPQYGSIKFNILKIKILYKNKIMNGDPLKIGS